MPGERDSREHEDARRLWVEEIACAIEEHKDETGGPFVVRFPWPLGDAQERLVRSLGVTPVYERGSDEELVRLASEAA